MDRKANILIIDDETGPRESLKIVLGPYYNIYTAEQGSQALEILRREPVDLVTVDLKMPGLSGIRVLEKIKAHDPDIEGIIITGYGSMDTAIDGLRLGAFDYIAKPFDANHIVELVRRALERRSVRTKLQQLKSDFLANTSHELRTPLSIIIGYVSLLLGRMVGELSAEQQRLLEKVYQSSAEYLELIDNVLCLSSINAGNVSVALDEFLFEDVILKNLKKFDKTACAKGIRVSLQPLEKDIRIRGDSTKISHIIRNLLHNAVKFTLEGKVLIRAFRSAQQGVAVLEIQDTGIGIKPDEMDAVYQPFWQSDGSSRRQFPGLGLGLTVARRLTDLIGGEIEITSQLGVGTRVLLSIPGELESEKGKFQNQEARIQQG